jgi:hypothetical protein
MCPQEGVPLTRCSYEVALVGWTRLFDVTSTPMREAERRKVRGRTLCITGKLHIFGASGEVAFH